MTVTFTNNAEGGTNGTTVTTANSGGTSGTAWNFTPQGAVTFSTAAAQHGSLGYHFAPTSGAGCYCRQTGFNDTTGAIRAYWVTEPGNPAARENVFGIFTSTGAGVVQIVIDTAGFYRIWDSTGTATSPTSNSRQAGDRLELSFTIGTTTSNGAWDFYLYRGDSNTVTEHLSSTTANLGTTNWDRFQIGKSSSSTWTTATNWDDIAAKSGSTTLWGPVATLPVAAFSTATIGTDVICTDSSTYTSPATAISSWAWTFGDGGTSTSQNPTHTYASGGTYTVGLTVTDNNSQTSTQTTHSVTVTAPGASAAPGTVLGTTSGFTTQAGSTTQANILSVLTDNTSGSPTLTTFAWSATGAELDLGQITIATPVSGQPLIGTVYVDRLNSSSGTFAAQLYEGATLRSSQTGIVIPDMTASGGSGTTSSGTIAGTVEIIFPWSDVQNVVDWNQLICKIQVTVS